MLGDRAHPTALIGGAFARTKSKIVAHLPPVFETLRVHQFSGQQFVRERPFAKDQFARRGPLELPFICQGLLLG